MRWGTNPTAKVFTRSAFFASEYASQMTSAHFAISAGCTCTGPTASQRAAPPPECPSRVTHSAIRIETSANSGYVSL
jgi:hypothetical protein